MFIYRSRSTYNQLYRNCNDGNSLSIDVTFNIYEYQYLVGVLQDALSNANIQDESKVLNLSLEESEYPDTLVYHMPSMVLSATRTIVYDSNGDSDYDGTFDSNSTLTASNIASHLTSGNSE